MKLEKIKYINRKNNSIEVENVPAEKFIRFLYYNPFGKLSLETLIKRKFISLWYGKKMNTAKSCEKISDFVRKNNIDLKEAKKDLKDFTSFNDFFIRELKPDVRKINFDKNSIASPADGKIFVIENFNEMDKFFIKGQEFSIKEFLKDEELGKKFEGGVFAIIRLAPADYHRYHFPLDGKISNSKKIEGYYYSVSPYAIRENFNIFCENKREFSLLKTKDFGDVGIVEVGATMVGGIKQSYTPNSVVKKGDEKGYFFFGGSTVVLLFEKDKIKIDEDIVKNSSNGLETKIFMGEHIGEKKTVLF